MDVELRDGMHGMDKSVRYEDTTQCDKKLIIMYHESRLATTTCVNRIYENGFSLSIANTACHEQKKNGQCDKKG
jgi:hypothetical protein